MESNSLSIRSYPKLIQQFANENFNLKVLCAALVGLLFILLLLVVFYVKRGPEVIALDTNGRIAKFETKITDIQLREAAENYISYRYEWTSDSINSQLKKAELFIEPDLVVAFRKSMVEVQRFVKEKKVKQKVYPYDVKVDFKAKKIAVSADRITEFDNLKAATGMKILLSFSIGDRTSINPWGIYINKEVEGAMQ